MITLRFNGLPDITVSLVFGIIVLLINLAIIVWIYRDAKYRGEVGALWILIVFIGGIVGLIAWFIVRPRYSETRTTEATQSYVNSEENSEQYP